MWFKWFTRIIFFLANVLRCPDCMQRLSEHARQAGLSDEARDQVVHKHE
jgi:hypothetical protein